MTDDVRQQLRCSDNSTHIDEQIGELVERITYKANHDLDSCALAALCLISDATVSASVHLRTDGETEEHFVIHADIRVPTCSQANRGGACQDVERRACMASVTQDTAPAHSHCWRDGEAKKTD